MASAPRTEISCSTSLLPPYLSHSRTRPLPLGILLSPQRSVGFGRRPKARRVLPLVYPWAVERRFTRPPTRRSIAPHASSLAALGSSETATKNAASSSAPLIRRA